MKETNRLQGAMAALRSDLDQHSPPPLPPVALAALRRRAIEQRHRQGATKAGKLTKAAGAVNTAMAAALWCRRVLAWPGAAGIAAVILLSLLLMWQPQRAVEPPAAPVAAFVPVVPAERWAAWTAAPESQAWLISTELPQQRLGQYGLPYDPARAAEMQEAQLLVAPSGEVLAVRLLQ
jgi:hypothetical protein